jgi:hypothetical protein
MLDWLDFRIVNYINLSAPGADREGPEAYSGPQSRCDAKRRCGVRQAEILNPMRAAWKNRFLDHRGL